MFPQDLPTCVIWVVVGGWWLVDGGWWLLDGDCWMVDGGVVAAIDAGGRGSFWTVSCLQMRIATQVPETGTSYMANLIPGKRHIDYYPVLSNLYLVAFYWCLIFFQVPLNFLLKSKRVLLIPDIIVCFVKKYHQSFYNDLYVQIQALHISLIFSFTCKVSSFFC